MRALVAIRTHKWTPDEQRLVDGLRAAGAETVVVYHNCPAALCLDLPIVNISDSWVREQGLRPVSDWGWRCGDYFYYALRQACPGYDYYWLLEPDIYVKGDISDFFERFENVSDDALGVRYGTPEAHHMFISGVVGPEPMQAYFPLTRLSGAAIDYLLSERRKYSAGPVRDRRFTNDEMFVFSWLAAHPHFSVSAMESHAPDWFEGCHFLTNPDIILSAILGPQSPTKGMFHPVRAAESFAREIGRRLGQSQRLRKMLEPSLGYLGRAEAEGIGQSLTEVLVQYFSEHPHPAGEQADIKCEESRG